MKLKLQRTGITIFLVSIFLSTLGFGGFIAWGLRDRYIKLDSAITDVEKDVGKLDDSRAKLSQEVEKLQEAVRNLPDNDPQKKQLLESSVKVAFLTSKLPTRVDAGNHYKNIIDSRKDEAIFLNSTLVTLIQFLGALFFTVTAYLSWLNIKATNEKQLAERFSQGTSLLAEENPQKCLGGVYLLEQIARNSPTEQWTVIQALAGFIREKSSQQEKEKYAYSIQRAAIVIAGRNRAFDQSGRIDLYKAYLFKAQLKKAHLEGVNLEGAMLDEADLGGSKLNDANLKSASLKRAIMTMTQLRKANLEGANLTRSGLAGSDLQGANLSNAILNKAELSGANLSGCLGIERSGQLDTALAWEKAKYDEDLEKYLLG